MMQSQNTLAILAKLEASFHWKALTAMLQAYTEVAASVNLADWFSTPKPIWQSTIDQSTPTETATINSLLGLISVHLFPYYSQAKSGDPSPSSAGTWWYLHWASNVLERTFSVLSDIHLDIMTYTYPAVCTDAAFKTMWAEFEWENKANLWCCASYCYNYFCHS
ncbi:hypothetical protein COLO4_08705 [Corchorus olitorius]|uniref:Coatomer beta subunit appendage platform domain-containing protein n=1 Tax=Corchorus olitorius TaxID=93759 RepID=A0A1R3KEX9_9ROSI|nr:hypothetical protein COLO4_08705 [Corchorus olitorius]